MTSYLRTMSLVALFSFHALAEAASGSSTSSTIVKSASLAGGKEPTLPALSILALSHFSFFLMIISSILCLFLLINSFLNSSSDEKSDENVDHEE